jgi:hypothetical protein
MTVAAALPGGCVCDIGNSTRGMFSPKVEAMSERSERIMNTAISPRSGASVMGAPKVRQ